MWKAVRNLILASSSMGAPIAAQPQQAAVAAVEAKAASFVPTGFDPPTSVEAEDFKLVPLKPALVKVDFDPYMSSVEHWQTTFTHGTEWPHKGISDADAMRDMQSEAARFTNRRSFAYAVLTPDGRRERGSVYLSPSPIAGHDAVVRMWLTKAEYDAGFDARLYSWVKKDWPFRTAIYPGRSVDWRSWQAMVAANTRREAAPGEKIS